MMYIISCFGINFLLVIINDIPYSIYSSMVVLAGISRFKSPIEVAQVYINSCGIYVQKIYSPDRR